MRLHGYHRVGSGGGTDRRHPSPRDPANVLTVDSAPPAAGGSLTLRRRLPLFPIVATAYAACVPSSSATPTLSAVTSTELVR